MGQKVRGTAVNRYLAPFSLGTTYPLQGQFSLPWIALLCSTRWLINLQGNAFWIYGRYDPAYVYCHQGEQIGYR